MNVHRKQEGATKSAHFEDSEHNNYNYLIRNKLKAAGYGRIAGPETPAIVRAIVPLDLKTEEDPLSTDLLAIRCKQNIEPDCILPENNADLTAEKINFLAKSLHSLLTVTNDAQRQWVIGDIPPTPKTTSCLQVALEEPQIEVQIEEKKTSTEAP